MKQTQWIVGIAILWGICFGIGHLPSEAAPIRVPPKPRTYKVGSIQQTVEIEDDAFRTDLVRCERDANNASDVVCTLYVTSLEDDMTVWLADVGVGRSRFIDFEGNEYATFAINEFGVSQDLIVLVPKVPVKAVLQFKDIPAQVSSVALFEVGFETYGHDLPVRFKNVDIFQGTAQNLEQPPEDQETQDPGIEDQETEEQGVEDQGVEDQGTDTPQDAQDGEDADQPPDGQEIEEQDPNQPPGGVEPEIPEAEPETPGEEVDQPATEEPEPEQDTGESEPDQAQPEPEQPPQPDEPEQNIEAPEPEPPEEPEPDVEDEGADQGTEEGVDQGVDESGEAMEEEQPEPDLEQPDTAPQETNPEADPQEAEPQEAEPEGAEQNSEVY